jgi:hypothetical protein
MEEESVDQLSDDEIDRQWEYNVADPTNPQLTDSQSKNSKQDNGNSHA